jgi:hypothetical protein
MSDLTPIRRGSVLRPQAVETDLGELLGWTGSRFHVWRDEQGRKVPYRCGGGNAKSNDPSTWVPFETARASLAAGSYTGMAFQLGELACGRWAVGTDLDLCRNGDGSIHGWAADILRRLPTYAEISPSGSGIKLIGLVDWVPDCLGTGGMEAGIDSPESLTGHETTTHKKSEIGLYPARRFFALTGRRLECAPDELCDITEAFAQLALELRQSTPARAALAVDASDIELSKGTFSAELLQRILDHPLAGPRWRNDDRCEDRSRCDFRLAEDMTLDFTQAELEAAIRQYPYGQIGSGKLTGYAADRQIRRLIAKAQAIVPPKVDLSAFALPPHDPETGEIIEPAQAPARIERDTGARGVPVAEAVMRPGGVLEDMVAWICATSISPQPFLALGAAICAVGAIAGRRYRTPLDNRTNIYAVALAASGSGKDHPRKCVRNALAAAGLADYLGGEELASGSAVMSAVARHPALLFQIDEFGHFLQCVLDTKSHAHHRREIMSSLTKLWTSADSFIRGTEYANQKDRPRIDIDQPCVCLYGSTVPEELWRAMQSGSIGDGSIARYLLFHSPENYPDTCEPAGLASDVPERIVDTLKAIAVGAYGHDAGNLAAAMAPASGGTPYTVPFDEGGAKAWAALQADQLAAKREHEGGALSAVWNRYAEHSLKLALIAAVSRNPVAPVMGAGELGWGRALAEHSIGTLARAVERYVADTQHEAMLKKVVEILRRHGDWIDGGTFARKTQFLSRRDRNEVITQLEESGMIELSREPTGSKPRSLIRLRENS